MDIYLSGTDVVQTVAMQDRNGNSLDVDSITYSVMDMNDAVVVASSSLASFVSGDDTASITVPASVNTIAVVPADSAITPNMIDTFNTREARKIEIVCSLISGNTYLITVNYGLESPDPLRIGLNSFQTLPTAELTSMDIPNLLGWANASEQEKVSALIAARSHICQLNFWLLNSNTNWGQDNLNYVPEGSYQTPYTTAGNSSMFIFNGNLALLTPVMYSHLPERFKTALRLAQVAEANSILGGDPIENRRREGLLLESIGEVKQMFRSGKPIDLPVSKQALRYLSAFVTFSKRIGRG